MVYAAASDSTVHSSQWWKSAIKQYEERFKNKIRKMGKDSTHTKWRKNTAGPITIRQLHYPKRQYTTTNPIASRLQ